MSVENQVAQSHLKCCCCDRFGDFGVFAVRVIDGELLGDVDYCRGHALKLLMKGASPRTAFRLENLGDHLDRCYRDNCSCVRATTLELCARCTRLADVWLTAGTDEEFDDLTRGILLCGQCASIENGEGKLPPEIREELRPSIKGHA